MDYLYIGKLVDTHGIKGEVRILLNDFFVYNVEKNSFLTYNEVISLLFKNNKEIYIGKKKEQFKIVNYRHHKTFEMLTFEGITNINEIISYKCEKCYVDKLLLGKDKIDLASLIGFKVINNNLEYGKIIDYQNNNGNILFEIKKNTNYFIPVNPNFIKKIDLISKCVYVENIEGLII